MKVLLDTHFLIELANTGFNSFGSLKPHPALLNIGSVSVSVASLWEVAIKSRIGKLPLAIPVIEWPEFLSRIEVPLLKIAYHHVLVEIAPEPQTRDPFDRLLLGVCAAEDMRLVTVDRALASHPLAWQSIPPVKN